MKIGGSKVERAVAVLLSAALVSGCATMFAPGSDKVTVNSIPPGAKVFDGADLLGTTPLTHVFKRSTLEHKTLVLRKEGYKNQEVQLGTALDSAALWNFAFFLTTMGVTSWGIDASSGNMVKYSPDSYLIDLEKEGAPASSNEQTDLDRLRFVAVNQDHLQKDVADGGGEYLRAYFEIRRRGGAPEGYPAFLQGVDREAPKLLSLLDPVEFYDSLEAL